MEIEELAAELIKFRTESPPGNEEGCARFLRDYLCDRVGDCECHLHRFSPHRANLVVRFGPARRPGLLMSGHIDVVPAGDTNLWRSSPFEAHIKEGKLFGRGAADMKGGLAAMVKAIESTPVSELRRGLVFVATAGEEIGYDGLKALVGQGRISSQDGAQAVVGEPTELRVVRGHKGCSIFRIRFTGRSAHSSRPDLGINAIENASAFIHELVKWRRELARTRDDELGVTLLNPDVIVGGTKSNVIPESCELTLDCRRIRVHSSKFVRNGLVAIIRELRKSNPRFRASVEMIFDYDTLLVSKGHALVRLAERLVGKPSTIAPYGTEAPAYQKLGIPTIILGPGSVKQAHVTNEFVAVSQIRRAVAVYSRLIKAVCMQGAPSTNSQS